MSDVRADCVFCRIADHREPASHVYEDDRVIVFMDIRPVNTGHTLVIPNQHASSLAELLDGDGVAVWRAGTRVAPAVRRSGVRCEGIDLLLADSAAAGQEVFHVHLHVLPRFAGDGFGFRFPEGYATFPSGLRLTTPHLGSGPLWIAPSADRRAGVCSCQFTSTGRPGRQASVARAALVEHDTASYRIGELAAKVGVTERTIRYYEELGLLDSVKRLEGGTRVYTDQDVRRLKLIRKLKVLGLSLQEMHELEGMYQTERSNRTVLPRLIELLDAHLETVDGRMAELHTLRDEIRSYREHVALRLLEVDH